MFDWKEFLNANRIEWVDSGANVSAGNVNIHCPWCGPDDPSQHLGISLTGKGYGCWRSANHRGKDPARLVQALLRISRAEAQRITGTRARATGSEALLERIRANLNAGAIQEADSPFPPEVRGTEPGVLGKGFSGHGKRPQVRLPGEFKPLAAGGVAARPFLAYLGSRGFPEPARTAFDYGLYYSKEGPFSNRVIFLVRFDGALVSWTGRAIGRDVIRYKSLSVEQSTRSIKDCLWNYDELTQGGDTLALCEGPFDALKVDYFGRDMGIRATCMFGKTISPAQVTLLSRIHNGFRQVLLIPDEDAALGSIQLHQQLAWLNIKIHHCVQGDPGDFTYDQVVGLRFVNN